MKATNCILHGKHRVEIDRVTEREWSELLTYFQDSNIYQTWSYGSVRWGASNLSHLVLWDGAEPLGIAQLRIVQPRLFRVGIAYLRWGPICHLHSKDLDPDVVISMARGLREEYANKRGLCLEIVPNAFEGSHRAKVFQGAFAQYECKSVIGNERYRTFLLDLSLSLDDVRRNLQRRWRQYLNSAERNDLQIREGQDRDLYFAFCKLYAQMWNRKRFRTGVNIEEFGRIQERLPQSQRMRVFLCEHKGEAVAALVCSAMGESGIYLLGASVDTDLRLRASYLLHWAVIKWLKDKGTRYYDLGGIDPVGNPGVYQFKRGFSGLDMSHLQPFVACDSGASAAFARVSGAVYTGLRTFQQQYQRIQSFVSQP
jgi:Acetyltransferase (GNAT) domain